MIDWGFMRFMSRSKPNLVEPSFLVSGALITNLGTYSADERFEQTRETFRSIRVLFPNSQILYVDSGFAHPHLGELLKAIPIGVPGELVRVLDLTDDLEIRQIQELSMSEQSKFASQPALEGYYKSLLEAVSIWKAIPMSGDDRQPLIKLSARYLLEEDFRREYARWQRDSSRWNLLIMKKRSSYLLPRVSGFEHYCRTVLWASGRISRIEIAEIFRAVKETLHGMKNSGKIIDLEHAVFRMIRGLNLRQVRRICVTGMVASNGKSISL